MKRCLLAFGLLIAVALSGTVTPGQQKPFKVLAFYATKAEPDHVLFAEGALKFYSGIAAKDNFTFDSTTNWDDMNDSNLAKYQVVVWLNDQPTKPQQKSAFQKYIENGGAWLGFHVSAYNDKDSNWPWFVNFLGGGVFFTNDWPPLPAKLIVDDRSHPVTKNVPASFMAPDNEWYIWKPSPRLNKDVQVLVTLDPSNYPIGFKDVLTSGDLPVVWTNTKYKMIYMNMGHGDKIFTTPIQNKLIEDALLWVGQISVQAVMPVAMGTEINPHAVVVNPKTNKVYAVNTGNNTVTVMNGSTNSITTVGVGTGPMAISINSVTNKIYVGNSGSGTVSVIDGATDAVSATVEVGALPYVIAVNPVTNKIYISKTFNNTMTVIDGATNTTSLLKTGIHADAIALNPITNRFYLTNYEGQNVTVLDGATNETSPIAAAMHLWAIAVNPVTNRVYLANAGSDQLTVIDGARNSVTNANTGKIPCAVAIDSLTHTIYVANTHDNNVSVIDGTNNSVVATVPTGNGPYAIAVDEALGRAYVSNMDKNQSNRD